ncbi:TPA: hypothetical protein N2R15_004650 [Citrobacter amalonaticus]|nr:hypothetical protein [Citrobacter amalonaticus]
MGLGNRIEYLDNAFNRFYARRKRWMWVVLFVPFISFFLWMFWVVSVSAPESGVTLIIHSRLERPILGFSVNGVAGGNSAAYNPNNPYALEGGKTTCCGIIKGRTAEIIWTLSMTGPQYEKGMRLEKRRVVIPLPRRKNGENDLHVHFLPGDKVLLGWSDNAWSPYDKHNPKYVSPPGDKE